MILINLGCGTHAPEGWINYDRSPNILLDKLPTAKRLLVATGIVSKAHAAPWPRNIQRLDLTRHIPIADGAVDGAYSSHAMEHLYLEDVRRLLDECHRVLRPDGVLRLALPDADAFLLSKASGAINGTAFNEMLGMHPVERPRGLRKVAAMAGGNLHKWQPTRDLVYTLMADANFRDIRECNWHQGALPRLGDVETRRESFFTEARA